MRAGPLRHYRLSLLEPNRQIDICGSEPTDYVEKKVVHAERVSVSAYKSDEAGEHFADARVQFNIRSVFEVKANWQVKDIVNDELYTVVAIIPNKNKQFNTLICEKVNE